MTEEEQVGVVLKFFAKPGVAAIKVIKGRIKIGDRLRFSGHTTEFEDEVISMQVEKQPVQEAVKGDLIGVKVKEKVRENDKVYRLVD